MSSAEQSIVSLKSIAVACGVSVSTVSRALSDPPRGRISQAVTAKIRDYAETCGYVRNPDARSLRLRRHEVITLVLPPYFCQVPSSIDFDAHVRMTHWKLIFAVISQARKYGYDVKLEPLQSVDGFSELQKKLNSSHSDGAILISFDSFGSFLEQVNQSSFPCVCMHFNPMFGSEISGVSSICRDMYPGCREAVDYLKAHHLDRVGFCVEEHIVSSRYYLDCLQRAMHDGGLAVSDKVYHISDLNDLRTLAGKVADCECDVFFCSNDAMAYLFVRELRYLGVRVPEDVSVIGNDNNPIYSELSTIATPWEAMAERAVDFIVGRIHGKDPSEEGQYSFVLPAYFIPRTTSIEER